MRLGTAAFQHTSTAIRHIPLPPPTTPHTFVPEALPSAQEVRSVILYRSDRGWSFGATGAEITGFAWPGLDCFPTTR